MQSNGFPVLPGVILDGWTREGETAVEQLSRNRGFSELLVRIEKPGQRWTSLRGGYTIPASMAGGLVNELAKQGMLALLLEPASPYSDLYSLAAVCDLHTGGTDIEVVGPGFDASDILRSDVTPHERLEVFLAPEKEVKPRITSCHVVESEAYRASVRRRLEKIGAAFRNPSFPGDIPGSQKGQLAQEAVQHLRKTGRTLLLNHLDQYEPIPLLLVDRFVAELGRLFRAFGSAQVPWKTLSVAGSFLKEQRIVFWDFFAPGSYQTTLLSRIEANE